MRKSKMPHHHAMKNGAVPLPTRGGEVRGPSTSPPLVGRGTVKRSADGGGASCFLILFLLALPPYAHADPAADQSRAEALYGEVRCVQCQSESIADSDAQIAADMRALIREDIKQGLSDVQIRKTLSDHYGDYVLFRPRLTRSNLLLWFLPVLIIVLGGAGLWLVAKKQDKSNDYVLSPEEQKKLKELMRQRD